MDFGCKYLESPKLWKIRKKIDKGGKGTILTFRLANYDPMEMMVIFKKSWE